MPYKTITIQNFKGIGEITLDFDKHATSNVCSLVGLNESGKTTVLEAIHWLSSPDSYDAHNIIPMAAKANFNGVIKVSGTLELTKEYQDKLAELLLKNHKFEIDRDPEISYTRRLVFVKSKPLTEHSKSVYEINIWGVNRRGKSKVSQELPEKSKIWKEAAEHITTWNPEPETVLYKDFLFEFPDKIYIDLRPQKTSKGFRFYKTMIEDILQSRYPGESIQSLLLDRLSSGEEEDFLNIRAVLDDLTVTITNTVVSQWGKIFQGQGTVTIPNSLQVTLDDKIFEDETGYFLRLNVKENGKTFRMDQRSLGFRWFLAFVLLTHFRNHQAKVRRSTLFLLDEPASNLHPTAQSRLLSAFDDLPKNQTILYSTHSHHLVNPKWLSSTFVVRNTGQGSADQMFGFNAEMTAITAFPYFQFASQNENQTDFYRPILDALEYQPSKLEMVPELVVLEGKNDFYTLPFMQQNMGTLDRSFNFYPGAGKDKVDYAIALYLAWGKSFLVMLDADRGGAATKKRLATTFGAILDNRVFTLADIDRSWADKEMEDIFSDEDRLRIIKTIFPNETEYQKSRFNTAILDCYINHRTVKISTHTKNRFAKIFKFLGRQLQAS